MSRTVEIVMNTYGLNKALQAWKENSRKTWTTLFRETAKGLAQRLPRVTPPFDVRNTEIEGDKSAKKRGANVIAGDIKRVFTKTFSTLKKIGIKRKPSDEQIARNSTYEEMKAAHSRLRNRRGRVPSRHKPLILVRKMAFANYIKRVQKKMGYLGAGWKAAANQTGANIPSWVKRHSAPTQARIRISEGQFIAVFRNLVRYAAQDDLQRRVDFAANRLASDLMSKLVGWQKKRITV